MAAVPWEIFGQTLIPSLQWTPCMGNQICLSIAPDLQLPVTSEQALTQPKYFTLKKKRRRKSIQSKDWADRLINKWATVPEKRRQTELLTGRARSIMAELFPGWCLTMIWGEHLPCKARLCSVR